MTNDELKRKSPKARAEKLTPERRSEIARHAAKIRWAQYDPLEEKKPKAVRASSRRCCFCNGEGWVRKYTASGYEIVRCPDCNAEEAEAAKEKTVA